MDERLISQAKDHILNTCIPLVEAHHQKMIIPCYRHDYQIFLAALALPEVKTALAKINIPVELVSLDRLGNAIPQILIATIDDVASGKLDHYLSKL